MKERQATVRTINFNDVLSVVSEIDGLQKQLVKNKQAVSETQTRIEEWKASARKTLAYSPALLAEFEAELAEMDAREQSRQARNARVNALREKYPR